MQILIELWWSTGLYYYQNRFLLVVINDDMLENKSEKNDVKNLQINIFILFLKNNL
jgi:hypothetical protein